MRHFSAAVLLLLFAFSLSSCSAAGADEGENESFVPGEIIVRFAKDVTEEAAREFVTDVEELTWKEDLSKGSESGKAALLGVPVGEEKSWVEKVEKEPQVKLAQVNHNNIELR